MKTYLNYKQQNEKKFWISIYKNAMSIIYKLQMNQWCQNEAAWKAGQFGGLEITSLPGKR